MNPKRNRRHKDKEIFLSKTKEMGDALNDLILEDQGIDQGDQTTDDPTGFSVNIHVRSGGNSLGGFARFDERFLKPFLIRKFTQEVILIVLLMQHQMLVGNKIIF